MSVGVYVGSNCIVYLHRGPCMPLEMIIISSFPNIPQGKKNFLEKRFRGGSGNEALKNQLDAIILLRKIVSSHRRGEREPYRPRKVAVKEQVGIIFHSPEGGAMFIYVS